MSISNAPVARSNRVLADALPQAALVDLVLVLAGAALVGLAAQISIPVLGSPVPITGQTFGVLFVGTALGARRGAISMGLYAILGLFIPWYSEAKHGWSVLSGATGGYIVGFIAAAAVCGWLAERGNGRSPMAVLGTFIVGEAVIYAFGIPWLMHSTGMSFSAALKLGFTPFFFTDLIKALFAAALLPAAWLGLKKLGRD